MEDTKSLLKKYSYILISSILIFNIALSSTAKAYKKITAEDLRDYMSASTLMIIVDVRTPEEFATGKIPMSINIPINSLGQQVREKNIGTTTKIILYSSNGASSDRAAGILEGLGYTDVSSMGSISDWDFSR